MTVARHYEFPLYCVFSFQYNICKILSRYSLDFWLCKDFSDTYLPVKINWTVWLNPNEEIKKKKKVPVVELVLF